MEMDGSSRHKGWKTLNIRWTHGNEMGQNHATGGVIFHPSPHGFFAKIPYFGDRFSHIP
jgi:hypothetical protein